MLDRYIRKYCVRRKEQVLRPPVFNLDEFILPRNSHLHFLDVDEEMGIKPDNPLLTYTKGNKVIPFCITGYSGDIKSDGVFVTYKKTLKPLVLDYYKRHPEFVNPMFGKAALLQNKNLMVTNYAPMELNYNYYNKPFAWWVRFQNRFNSIFENIEKSMKEDNRTHFILLDAPSLIPSISQLQRFESEQNNSNVKRIANSERMIIAQLWNWFAGLDTIFPKERSTLERLFFIFRYQNRWMCFNLSMLRGFMRTDEDNTGWDENRIKRNMLLMFVNFVYGEEGDLVEVEDDKDIEEEIVSNSKRTTEDLTDVSMQVSQQKDIKGELLDAFNILDDVENRSAEEETLIANEALLSNLEQINNAAIDDLDDINEETPESVQADNDVPGVVSNEEVAAVLTYAGYTPKSSINHQEMFNEHAKNITLKGGLTPQQMKRMEKIADSYNTIPDPITGKGTLREAAFIDPNDLKINKEETFAEDIHGVVDPTMYKSTLVNFDQKYIKNVLNKDVFNAVLAIQRHGIAVKDYKVERVKKLGDEYDLHTVKLIPLEGGESTISFKIPVVDHNGYFQSRGVKLTMKKQRVDVPIRKISPDEVALTSYMSKMFVERSQFAAYSSERWLKQELVTLNNPDVKINWGSSSSVVEGNPYDHPDAEDREGKLTKKKKAYTNKQAPRPYTQLARMVSSIEVKGYTLYFNVHQLEKNFGAEVVKAFEGTRNKQILLGKGNNTLLVLTNDGEVWESRIDKDESKFIGTIYDLIGIDTKNKPFDCAELNVVGKTIPLGFILGYYIGLGNLLKLLEVEHRLVPKGTRGLTAEKDEVIISFNDQHLIVNVKDYKTQLIISGFNRYKNHIKNYSLYDFDKPSVYGSVLNDVGLPARYQRELSILREMWIDPITEEELKRMGEPTDFVMLLIRAAELLEFDQHPDEMDRAYMRDRGFERFSGFVYDEMIKAIRVYDSNPIRSKAKLTLNPEAVWMSIITDETVCPVEESNPVHNLKDAEIVVYRGTGGRSSRTMNMQSRSYTKASIGVDSECSVDNGDAGTVRFLTANPNYNSLRGTINEIEAYDETVNSSCLNTSMLLAAYSDIDDMKRRNFVHIQNSRTTNSEGAHIAPVRTGYERVLPYRTADLYATMAKDDGTVKSITENAITVVYKSGEEVVVELGKRDGKWAGKIIPHQVITNLKEGQKVTKGSPIAYNPMFFDIDKLGGTLYYKAGVLARVGLVETEFTFEDSSEISLNFANKLGTKNCVERFITVTFDQEISELVKIGDKVDYDTTLMIMQNNIGGVENRFTDESLEALRDISRLTPRAKNTGVVTAIDCVYVGEYEDMSDSLQSLVSSSDRKLFKKAKDMGREKVTGQKKVGERFNGQILEPNTVVIRIVIDVNQDMSVGSKLVFSHQMKSVVSNLFDEDFTTEDGQSYDALFSYTSFIKRIVNSGILNGILNTYLVENGRRMCEIYDNG